MAAFSMDEYYQGISTNSYEYFGAHPVSEDDSGIVFRVYAPAAHGVDVVGEFLMQKLVSFINSGYISRVEQ